MQRTVQANKHNQIQLTTRKCQLKACIVSYFAGHWACMPTQFAIHNSLVIVLRLHGSLSGPRVENTSTHGWLQPQLASGQLTRAATALKCCIQTIRMHAPFSAARTWQKLLQYSVDDSSETSCCRSSASSCWRVACRPSIAKNVSSSSSRLCRPLQSSSASAFSSAMFTGSHGAYAHIQSCDSEGPPAPGGTDECNTHSHQICWSPRFKYLF